MRSSSVVRGGLVVLLGTLLPAAALAQGVTFANDVAPILYEHCVACHRPGAIGPFSLVSYEDARAQAEQVAAAAERRAMPPWKPVAGYGQFQGARTLSEAQIAVLGQWVESDTPQGDAAATPPVPRFEDGWRRGEPDLVLTVDTPYTLEAGSGGVYRNFVVPTELTDQRWVSAVELRPSAASVVHHARILLDATGDARIAVAADVASGYDGLMLDHGGFPDGHVLGWSAGPPPAIAPTALAWQLNPGTDLVVQLYLLRRAASVTVQPSIGLYFTDAPPAFSPVSVLLNSKTIDIPAGESNHLVEDRFRLPVAVDLLAISPHAHRLGRRVEAMATLPDGSQIPLIRIDDWDLDWQDEYRYERPIHLPAETVVTMRFVFDNSTDNPKNPRTPPEPVRFGSEPTDEMAELRLQVIPTDLDGRELLLRNLEVKGIRDDILGYQARLRADPTDHESQTALAAQYLQVGEVDLAIEQLETVIQRVPDYAEAHFNLGSSLVAKGLNDEAIAAYRCAIEIRSNYSDAHNNLGGLLEATGGMFDAIAHYRLALQFDPRNVNARYNLGHAMQVQGDFGQAAAAYEEAARIQPDDAVVHSNLGRVYVALREYELAVEHYQTALRLEPTLTDALVDLSWLRATAPQPELRDTAEAIDLAARAGALAGADHPVVMDARAAAYASGGEFEIAVTTAREAAERARTLPGFEQLAPEIELRLRLYLSFRPYRMALRGVEP